jgi:sporulation protein YlmC with PRC-barrel domain
LVENQDVIRALDSFSDYQHWIMASDQLKQRYIVSIDGKRVGQLDDLVLDDRGRVSGISLGQVFVKGPLAQIKEIPTEAIRSLGPDVIIVDLDRVEIIGLMDEPELSPQDAQALHAPYVSGVSADREPAEVPYRERGVATAYADAYGAQIYDDHIPYRR